MKSLLLHLPRLSRRVKLLRDLMLLLALAALWAILVQPSFTPEMAMERAQTYYHFGPGTVIRSDQVPPPEVVDPEAHVPSYGEGHLYFLLEYQEWNALVLCDGHGLRWGYRIPAFWRPDPSSPLTCVEYDGLLAGTVQDPRVARIMVHYTVLTYNGSPDGFPVRFARTDETRELQGNSFLLTLQSISGLRDITVRAYDAAGTLLWEGAPVPIGSAGAL